MSDGDQRGGLRAIAVDARGRPLKARGVTEWLRNLAPARARGVVSIALVSDARVRALNRQYRGKDYATDVLSFPADDAFSPQRTSRTQRPGRDSKRDLSSVSFVSFVVNGFLGEIVIARGVARRQARAARHSELAELRVLALHGLLHLLGYDHEQDDGLMQRVERRLRRKGGLREGLIERARRRRVGGAKRPRR